MDVIKTLKPGDCGTKKLAARYGDRLVCVRYRKDEEKKRRYTTIELIVDEGPIDQNKLYRLAPEERALLVELFVAKGDYAAKRQIVEAGGAFNETSGLWNLALGKVVKLGLVDRMKRY